MKITQKDIDQAFLDYSDVYAGVKEDYFALLYLMRKFKLSRDEAATQVAFHGNDYGFDAFHFDRDARNLYLYQFKWSESCLLFKGSFERLKKAGMEAVFGTPKDPAENPLLAQLRATIHENKAIIDRVFMHFVFNGEVARAEQSEALSALSEDVENKKYLIHKALGRDNVDFKCVFISNADFRIGGAGIGDATTYSFEINFHSPLTTTTDDGYTMHVGFAALADLMRMYRTMGERLFDRNIRSGLGGEKPANKAIKNAIRSILLNGAKADTFVFNHNGITLSVEKLEPISDGRVRLVEPRILNGAQTITTISKFLDDNKDNEVIKHNQSILGSTRVVARVVGANSDDFITQVTICNNRQNPVNAWNLRASDLVQLQLADRFHDDLGVFYERQEGAFIAFLNLPPDDRQTRGISENKPIQIRRLAHTFLASQGEIDKFSRISDVFEIEKLYRDTFREAYLSVDPHRILLAYKIQVPLGKVVRNVIEGAAARFELLRRAKNLIWALLIQAIWNHPKFQQHVEAYGQSMVIEYPFVELLNSLASQRVKPIIAEALKRPNYQAKVENADFGFLRTNPFYRECMDIASDKYGWKKCGLAANAAAKA